MKPGFSIAIKNKSTILVTCGVALCATLLTACQTPKKTKVAHVSTQEHVLSEVQYTLAEEKFDPEVKCILVGDINLTDSSGDFSELDKVLLVRRTLVGNLFQKNYTQVPLSVADNLLKQDANTKNLLRKTNCDAIITGEIYRFSSKSFVAASSTEVGLDLEIKNVEGEVIWRGRHLAASRDGSLPFSPLSLLSGIFLARANASDEVALQMVDSVARRLIDTLPTKSQAPITFAKTEKAVKELFIPVNKIELQAIKTASELLDQGQYRAAIQAAKLELQSDLNTYQSLLIIGDAHRHLNEFHEAIENYLLAVADDESQSAGYEKLSLGYLNLRRIDLAKASLSKAISINPQSSGVRYQLAIINESQNLNKEAAKLYFQAGELAIREKNKEAIYSSLTALERLSDSEYGYALYEALLDRAEAFQKQELNAGA